MVALYNEIDPFAAAWLRELIRQGHIAPGDVAECSIEDLTPNDIRGYTQFHAFAGIGVWSYSLRRAGWPDDRPVWTMSCPCQPFSMAGKGAGFADERHLWPAAHYLIEKCGPSVVLGEQVASKDGLAWLDLVQADLEGSGYAAGAVDLCAAGVGAPHIRQRLWWVAKRLADTDRTGQHAHVRREQDHPVENLRGGASGGLEHSLAGGNEGKFRRVEGTMQSEFGIMADTDLYGLQGRSVEALQREGRRDEGDASGRSGASLADPRWAGPTNGLWRDADWLFCRDGKWRPVEPGTFPLAHGDPARVGRLRGYGNAIVAPAAQAFIEAVQDTLYPAIDIRLTDLSEMTNDRKDIFA